MTKTAFERKVTLTASFIEKLKKLFPFRSDITSLTPGAEVQEWAVRANLQMDSQSGSINVEWILEQLREGKIDLVIQDLERIILARELLKELKELPDA